MRSYVTDEAVMAVPEAWADGSNTVLTYDHSDGEIRLMVVEMPTDEDEPEQAFEALVARFERSLPRFEVLDRTERELDGRPGLDLTFAYRDGPEPGLRRVAAAPRNGHLVLVAIQGHPTQRPAIDELATTVFDRMRWRSPDRTTEDSP